MDASNLLKNQSLVPVVVIDDAKSAVPLVEALLEAGVTAIEITLRTSAALEAIENVAKSGADIIVGAGSVRSASQFRDIANAGAKFAVSPGSTESLIETANDIRMPFVPGAATASEMLKLLGHGYMLQKFFPAELSGGLPMLKAVSAPIPEVQFFPTGGVNLTNIKDYLALACVSCVGGSWFVSQQNLAAGDYAAILTETREAMEAVQQSD